MAKGGNFEREFCWVLSRWWCGNPNELIFWRTSNSGGGATIRHRKGISNKSHAGDITAIEPTGRPFCDLITIEAKRGYNDTANLHSLLDRQIKKNTVAHPYEKWIKQAKKAAKRANSAFWMIVHRRDHKQALCLFPNELFTMLVGGPGAGFRPLPSPFFTLKIGGTSLVGMKWRHFLFHVDPDNIRETLDYVNADNEHFGRDRFGS